MKKTIFLSLTFVLCSFISTLLFSTEAQAVIDYDRVRADTQQACYPLCNLREYEINKRYFPYENPFYGAQAYNPQYNPYYSGNLYGNYPNYNPVPQNNAGYVLGSSDYLQNSGYFSGYFQVPQAQANYQNGTQNQNYTTSNQNNPNAYYAANNATPTTYQYGNNVNSNPQYSNPNHSNNLPASGNKEYFIYSLVIILSLGVVYIIRKIRKEKMITIN